jgi:prepilin-type N-terminal cleavage/methylation domain-containing protein
MPNRKAFTLIEVLVALIIFSLAAVVLASSYLNILNSYELAQKSNRQSEDLSFAKSQLFAQPDVHKAKDGNEFDDGDRHVKWTAEIATTGTADLFSVTFTCEVTDPSQPKPQKDVETFMLLRPTWSDPTEAAKLRQKAADRIAKLKTGAAQ